MQFIKKLLNSFMKREDRSFYLRAAVFVLVGAIFVGNAVHDVINPEPKPLTILNLPGVTLAQWKEKAIKDWAINPRLNIPTENQFLRKSQYDYWNGCDEGRFRTKVFEKGFCAGYLVSRANFYFNLNKTESFYDFPITEPGGFYISTKKFIDNYSRLNLSLSNSRTFCGSKLGIYKVGYKIPLESYGISPTFEFGIDVPKVKRQTFHDGCVDGILFHRKISDKFWISKAGKFQKTYLDRKSSQIKNSLLEQAKETKAEAARNKTEEVNPKNTSGSSNSTEADYGSGKYITRCNMNEVPNPAYGSEGISGWGKTISVRQCSDIWAQGKGSFATRCYINQAPNPAYGREGIDGWGATINVRQCRDVWVSKP